MFEDSYSFTILEEYVNIVYQEGSVFTCRSSDLVRIALMRYGPDHYGLLVQKIDPETKDMIESIQFVFTLLVRCRDEVKIRGQVRP